MALQVKTRKLFHRNPNKIREGKLDTTLTILNITFLLLGVIVIAIPIMNYFSRAFNDGALNKDIVIFPVRLSMYSLRYVLAGELASEFWRSFLNSVILVVVITLGSNLVEALAAYPLSKFDFPFRSGVLMYFVITMLFSAGVLPSYLLISQMGLLDTIWAIVVMSISNVSNLLYFKVFFEGLPGDIEEAAKIDGASDLQMFFRIVLPMSLPVIGSCCFFTIVGVWNSYGGAMIYIGSAHREQYPLALFLYNLMTNAALNRNDPDVVTNAKNIEAAAMFVGIVPIICLYPYVIKYIKSGLTIGSVKS